jgi:hypothetical protein
VAPRSRAARALAQAVPRRSCRCWCTTASRGAPGGAAEGCWIRVDASEPAPARPSASADGAAIARGAVVYVGTLLNQPHKLTTLAQGDRVRFLPDPGGRHPLLVTEAYLAERAAWTIAPCPRCGLGEAPRSAVGDGRVPLPPTPAARSRRSPRTAWRAGRRRR